MSTSEQLGEIALIFFAFRDQLKIYHLQTTNYARHIAADALVSDITIKMDRFMETLQGARNKRMKIRRLAKVLERGWPQKPLPLGDQAGRLI